jgi:hypothetical protein
MEVYYFLMSDIKFGQVSTKIRTFVRHEVLKFFNRLILFLQSLFNLINSNTNKIHKIQSFVN